MTSLFKLEAYLCFKQPNGTVYTLFSSCNAIVELNELWKKIEPDAKRIFKPLVDTAKNFDPESVKQLTTKAKEERE